MSRDRTGPSAMADMRSLSVPPAPRVAGGPAH
jgi:hypothetical protein